MNREQILEILIRSKPALQAQFRVRRMALFGSTVRDEARDDSDELDQIGFVASGINYDATLRNL